MTQARATNKPEEEPPANRRQTGGEPAHAALRRFLDDLVQRMARTGARGHVASYIPELAKVDPRHFGISVCLAGGAELSAGDAAVPFSIQSISKVFALAIALQDHGALLWQRIGREPSNYAFSSIVELENEHGRPRNPFVNAGALVVTDANLTQAGPNAELTRLLAFIRAAAGDDAVAINERVAASEFATADRNLALAYFLHSCGNLRHASDLVVRTYSRQCAIEMSCAQLARAGRCLARLDGGTLLAPHLARHINALMLTAGHYNGSGKFAYSVSFPGKSGVGGGILAVVPGVASIAVWSPGLNAIGNSELGTLALHELSEFTDWSVF